MSEGIQLVLDKLKKKPVKGNYHPNTFPWKVIIYPQNNDAYIKREYTTQEKAERFALEQSKKHPYTKITVECIRLPKDLRIGVKE